jgi:hypothetical protein
MIQIVPGENVQTQVKVLKINSGSYGISLDLDIPAMGKKEFKFIDWRQKGPAPEMGAMLLATLRHKRRSQYWMKQGSFSDNESQEVTGEEKPWQLDWECLEVEPLTASTPAVDGSRNGATVFVDGNMRYRIDQETINDREAIRMVLTHGAAEGGNLYKDMGVVLVEAEPVASWLNHRLAARLGGGMVGAAQEAGAVITRAEKEAAKPEKNHELRNDGVLDIPDIEEPYGSQIRGLKNRDDLQKWVETMGWPREELLVPLQKAGYDDSRQYLGRKGNTIHGLAEFLLSALGGGSPDSEGADSW